MAEKFGFEAPTWNKIYSLLLDQSQKICESGFKPEVIVGVCRGGWLPARVLSDLLENSHLASVKVESYFGISEAKSRPTLSQGLSVDVGGKSVLVVDEVADSGRSLKIVTQHVMEQGAREVKTVVLYVKSSCGLKPDFCGAVTDCWVVFPWEIKETLRGILDAHIADAAQAEAEIARLARAGVPKQLITRFLREFSEAKPC